MRIPPKLIREKVTHRVDNVENFSVVILTTDKNIMVIIVRLLVTTNPILSVDSSFDWVVLNFFSSLNS